MQAHWRVCHAFFLLAAALSVPSLLAQSDLWTHVSIHGAAQFPDFTPSPSQQKSIRTLLKSRLSMDGKDSGCEITDPTGEWLKHLEYETLPLSSRAKVLLVESGPGCFRGGQGSNGGMWLVRIDGPNPTVLASPQQGFNGWIYSVEPAPHQGFRDIVVGWHMSAYEAGLTYFRFDGQSYRRIGSATLRTDEHGNSSITQP